MFFLLDVMTRMNYVIILWFLDFLLLLYHVYIHMSHLYTQFLIGGCRTKTPFYITYWGSDALKHHQLKLDTFGALKITFW